MKRVFVRSSILEYNQNGFSLDRVFWNTTRTQWDFCSTFFVEVFSFILFFLFLLQFVEIIRVSFEAVGVLV